MARDYRHRQVDGVGADVREASDLAKQVSDALVGRVELGLATPGARPSRIAASRRRRRRCSAFRASAKSADSICRCSKVAGSRLERSITPQHCTVGVRL